MFDARPNLRFGQSISRELLLRKQATRVCRLEFQISATERSQQEGVHSGRLPCFLPPPHLLPTPHIFPRLLFDVGVLKF